MIFWISAGMLAAGVILFVISVQTYYDFEEVATVLLAVGAVSFFVCGTIIGINHIGPKAVKENLTEDRTAIVAKIESGLYLDDMNLLDKDIVGEIKEYNQDLRTKKALQRDFWVGIFIPNIYDDAEYIDYDMLKDK